MFKITTIIFMALSAVFAGLYFVGKPPVSQEVVYIEKPAKKIYIKENPDAAADETRDRQSTAPVKPRIIVKEINPFAERDIDEDDANLLIAVRDFYRQEEGRDYYEDHPILFQRLSLNPEIQKQFLNIMADMDLADKIRPKGWMTDEEKEELKERKKLLLETLEIKVENILGEQDFATYKNYSQKSRQYRMVADMDKKLIKNNFNLNENQQDQLADVLYNNTQAVTKYDWDAMKRNPEMMDEWYALYKDSQGVMKGKAQEFLEEPQLKVFESTLSSNLKRYAKYISHYKHKQKEKK